MSAEVSRSSSEDGAAAGDPWDRYSVRFNPQYWVKLRKRCAPARRNQNDARSMDGWMDAWMDGLGEDNRSRFVCCGWVDIWMRW